jgi:UDP-GlcNAc:undecaprenyl-phosphate/decaprenyl-phosphate GlcNAc-1-phosphate transferase
MTNLNLNSLAQFDLLSELPKLFTVNIYWIVIFIAILFFLCIFIWPRFVLSSAKYGYDGKQRVHEGEVPRLGGLIFYISFIFLSIVLEDMTFQNKLQSILLCLLPMIIITVSEDIFHNIGVRLRLLSIFFSALLLLYFMINSWPSINNFGVISRIFENASFNYLFFTLCLVSLANGCNFIDGMNGLFGFYSISAICSCIILSIAVGDLSTIYFFIGLIFFLIVFLIFNFPWGRLFMGDSGAYMIAMLLGIWAINFFGIHSSISSWNAVIIFFYPIIELIFSIIRKIKQKKSPFHPDREHLHLKIYDSLNRSFKRPRLANNLTTFFLSFFWLAPPLIIPWIYLNNMHIFITLIILCIAYLTINFVIPKQDELVKNYP